MSHNITEKFSNNYKKSLRAAAELALELNHEEVDPEHILYGLILQKGSVGAEIFASLEVKAVDIKNNIAKLYQTKDQKPTEKLEKNPPYFSENSKELIQKSVQIAFTNKHRYIGTEHLLAAIIQNSSPEIKKIMEIAKIAEKDLIQQTVSILKSVSKLPDLTETFKVIGEQKENFLGRGQMAPVEEILELFGAEITAEKYQQKIDPVIGRDEEISRIIQILSRRNKNNPIILGDPGVGKTALVEGLAKKIASGEVPEVLKNKKVYTLDLASTVAGTIYRGEFEARLKQIIDEAKSRPDVILFIDEIHNIVGTGSASGSMDAANILKPALARGEIRCIGATTYEDYRKSIENDPALSRRFQPVKISEPSTEEAKKILQGVKKYYEKFHGVAINDEAIDAAVTLSQKYLPEKFLPDKAIDLIDEAASCFRVNRELSSQEKELKNLLAQISSAQKQKQEAIENENFALALELKKSAEELKQKISELESQISQASEKTAGQINSQDIARIIAKATGIPAEDLLASEKKRILKIDKKLKEKIIGQDEAMSQVADFIRRAKAGLTSEHKPLASFLFVGPSGVGKTYTAKIIAELLFGEEKSLVKIDMSEYGEKFNISKLIGAPAGYVGYKESGQLTEKIKHKPYSVVLFDEIEKANPDVFDLLLQVLEDGYLTDAVGAKINFQNTIIIMTSNLGSQHFGKNKNIGFSEGQTQEDQAIKEKVLIDAKKHFKPEFINRLDKIVYFNPLLESDLAKIAKIELENLKNRVQKQGLNLEFDLLIIKLIAQESQKANQGARGIKKAIQEMAESPLSELILTDEAKAGNTIFLSAQNGQIKISLR